jgi:multidrug efflux pump subunit AcrA (membrane-fusion protein)
MSTPGTVIKLGARAAQSAMLAFAVDGIIQDVGVTLGATVPAFNIGGFYNGLDATVVGNPAELQFNSARILARLGGFPIVSLRAESAKAALDAAVAARANAYYAKYANQTAIIGQMNTSYNLGTAGSKPQLLRTLTNLAAQHGKALEDAYTADGLTGVVKSTTEVTASSADSQGYLLTDSTGSDESNWVSITSGWQTTAEGIQAGPDIGQNTISEEQGEDINAYVNSGSSTGGSESGTQTGSSAAISTGTTTGSTTSTYTGYGYRVPMIEIQAQIARAQISLIDESFKQFMAGQTLPNLIQVFKNELAIIDAGVRRLQIAYLDTLLFAPFAGTVTAVRSHPGEFVKAGQPIVRLEDTTNLLLVGTIVFRGPIVAGANTATVTSQLFSSGGGTTAVTGPIVAARGDRCNDDWWHIVISVPNPGGGAIPAGYWFDYDDTTITIT